MAPSLVNINMVEIPRGTRTDEEANHDRRPTKGPFPPRFEYTDTTRYTGKDLFGRNITSTYDDRRIKVRSGKFRELQVQCTEDVLDGKGGTTWKRRRIKSVGPLTLRLADWPFSSLGDDEGPLEVLKSFRSNPMKALNMLGKSFSLIPPMIFLGTIFRPSSGSIENFGRYSPVPYRFHGMVKKSRNAKDDTFMEQDDHRSTRQMLVPNHQPHIPSLPNGTSSAMRQEPHIQRLAKERVERILLPRKLCFLDQSSTRQSEQGVLEFHSTNVEQWKKETGKDCPEYLFAAFISSHFQGPEGRKRAHELARYATKKAGLQCYWIALNCISKKNEAEKALDIWRISDVMRGSKELAVILRSPEDGESVESLLKQWSRSVWTLPELLLSPGSDFKTYHYSGDLSTASSSPAVKSTVVPKNQFSARCLESDEDRYQVRRLLEHYLGSLKLSDLELTTVALQCFSSRAAGSGGKNQVYAGDYSYALMGLLGRRPNICPSDSGFLSFARLSLENYNSQLFERSLCVSPADPDQPWHNMKDAYGAQLWDIEPFVQVAGIGEYLEDDLRDLGDDALYEREYFGAETGELQNQGETTGACGSNDANEHTESVSQDDSNSPSSNNEQYFHSELEHRDVVVLDGCYAATVHWDQFRRVWHAKRLSWKRRVLQWMLRLNIILFLIGVILTSLGSQSQSRSGYYYPTTVLAPFIIRTVYGGKFWDTQPWFFGFEGHASIREIETKIFGIYKGRLTWGYHASSPLSLRSVVAEGENRWVEPRDPCNDPETKRRVEKAHHAKPGDMRVFTIVDTYSMTATLFEARRPPDILLVCGSEGGMQRALGCSFEWTTSTFYKETVLRLETRVLERMERIRRVRLHMKRSEKETKRATRTPVG